ncbi:hypothetical protein [uncultured Dokdonia sp.]|uniref:hypothetical protein n=1 Tax=uncultured Dokdonia sp. TaxID=575653 RepID=UPI002617188B|nr:hypothetical protein [uncultured Dokdonia sp.]
MKRIKYVLLLGLVAFFSTLTGASLKVWGYEIGSHFLLIGLIMATITVFLAIPKKKSFLDRWI